MQCCIRQRKTPCTEIHGVKTEPQTDTLGTHMLLRTQKYVCWDVDRNGDSDAQTILIRIPERGNSYVQEKLLYGFLNKNGTLLNSSIIEVPRKAKLLFVFLNCNPVILEYIYIKTEWQTHKEKLPLLCDSLSMYQQVLKCHAPEYRQLIIKRVVLCNLFLCYQKIFCTVISSIVVCNVDVVGVTVGKMYNIPRVIH